MERAMKVVIIEDEELAAGRLERMIKKYDSAMEIVAKMESVEESVEWFKSNPSPDLIFLDIHLEDGLSFSIFEQTEVRSPIIFTTAFDEYAIKAFKLKSIDYLLKPIVQEELNNAITKYRDLTGGPQSVTLDVNSIYEILNNSRSNSAPTYKSRFAVQIGTKLKTIPIDDVAYFYSEDGATYLVCLDKHTYIIDDSLDKLAAELNPDDFFRVNRQHLVSLTAIANVHVFPKSRLKLDLTPPLAKECYVSLDKVTKFKAWLDK